MTLSLACQSRCLAGHVSVFAAEHFGSWDDSLVFEEGQQRPQNPIDGGTNRSSTFFTRLGTIQLWTRQVPWVLELHVWWEHHTATGTGQLQWATWRSPYGRSSIDPGCQRPFGQGIGWNGGFPWDAWISYPTWPLLARDSSLANAPRIADRASCSACFNTHVTPLKRHQDTGTTFEEDCREFFCRHGGREAYMHTIIYWEPGVFHFWPFLLLCWLHSMHSFNLEHLSFTTVCWPQFPFLSSGRALTPTTSYAWQRTSCAWVLLFQET